MLALIVMAKAQRVRAQVCCKSAAIINTDNYL